MAVIKVPTSFNIDLEFEVPEFYRRLVAYLIDYLILFLYTRIAWEIFKIILSDTDFSSGDAWYDMSALYMIIFILPVLSYHLVLEILMNGQSFGKKIMSLRVVNENGGRPSISQFFIRWLMRDIWFLILFFVGLSYANSATSAIAIFIVLSVFGYFLTEIILIVSSKKGQRIGDILARTILIRTNKKSSIEETVFREVDHAYTPVFPMIMQLSDKDINAIKTILETSRKKGDYRMAESAAEKIKGHLKIETSMSPFDFLDTLLYDYNYLSTK